MDAFALVNAFHVAHDHPNFGIPEGLMSVIGDFPSVDLPLAAPIDQ